MKVLYWAVEYGASFIECFIAYRVFSELFRGKRKKGNVYTDIVLSAFGAFVVLIFNSVALFSYITLFFAWVYLSVSAKILYKINIIFGFAATSFYFLCMYSIDFLGLTLTAGFFQKEDNLSGILTSQGVGRTLAILFFKSMWILIYIALRRYLRKISIELKGACLMLVLFVPGLCGLIFMIEQSANKINSITPITWFAVSILLLAFIFIIYFTSEQKQEKLRTEALKDRNELLNKKYDSINRIYRDNSKLYHDLNNHMNVLYHILEEGHIATAKQYIQEISKPIMQLTKDVWTGVDVVDTVINSKIQRMEEAGIKVDINVECPQNSNILPNDLCTILSNIIDNSIEAVEKLPDGGYINITMRRINYFLFIRVVNPCCNVKRFETFPPTTKEDKIYHGWGLQSVGDIVKKYNGTLECINENCIFKVEIMLPFDM